MHFFTDLVAYLIGRRRPQPSVGQRVAGAVAAVGAAMLAAAGSPATAPSGPVAPLPIDPAPAVHRELPLAGPPTTATVAPTTASTAGPGAPPLAMAATPATDPPAPDLGTAVVGFALAQVGKPYERGTAGPDTYDCSGLVLAAYRSIGVELPHWSVAQADEGRAVDWPNEPIRPGDLVFTRGDTPTIDLGHVGIAVDGTRWISAPRPGRRVHQVPIPVHAIQRVRRLLP